MASLVVAGDTSGSVTLSAPAIAGSVTITLPSSSGTMAVTGGSPSFATLTVTGDASISGLTVGKGTNGVAGNTAFGTTSLAGSNSGGGENTAVGYESLAANTTGADQVAVGYRALAANTTGTENVSIGAAALRNSTTGNYNVAVGRSALNQNTTASYNTAVGYQAGYTATTNISNCFIGAKAGYSATGANNTYVGAYNSGGNGSGSAMTSGNSNTILGGFTGNQGGLDIRTSSNFIVLSDGDGNPRAFCNNAGTWHNTTTTNAAHKVFEPNGQGSYLITEHPSSAGTGYTYHAFTWNGGTIGEIRQNGTTAVSYVTTSDYRLKENVQPLTGALAKVQALKPVTYTWKSAPDEAGEGFIAHELAEVCPQAVSGEKDAVNEDGSIKPQGIDTSFLVATLTAAIQELNAKVEAQAAEIAALKGAN